MDMTRYLKREEFLETYGNENVEKLVKVAMPELALGSIMSEWTDCKSLLSSTPQLDSFSFIELVKLITTAQKKGLLEVLKMLELLARILVMSPHSMYVEFAISAYN